MAMPASKRTRHKKRSGQKLHQAELEQVDETEIGLKNGIREEYHMAEGYEEDEEIHRILDHSKNGYQDSTNSHNYPRGAEEGEYVVSRDLLSIQSDDRLPSSSQEPPPVQQQSYSRYPQNFTESFDFDGYSPTQQVEEYHDINGR